MSAASAFEIVSFEPHPTAQYVAVVRVGEEGEQRDVRFDRTFGSWTYTIDQGLEPDADRCARGDALYPLAKALQQRVRELEGSVEQVKRQR